MGSARVEPLWNREAADNAFHFPVTYSPYYLLDPILMMNENGAHPSMNVKPDAGVR